MAVVYTTIPPVRPSTADCSVSYHKQPLDHFSYTENRSFAQRVFTNDQHWRPGGPILFYCGNEASVELYVNATGWMWERAAAFGALLVWAEHRYYGKTQPFGSAASSGASGGGNASTLRWLTLEQALADYATLIHTLKAQRGAPASTKVIALGGSYGGMLAAWLRMHYPSAVDAALAASAPVLAFNGLARPGVAFDGNAFWRVVTRDASPAAGAHPDCVPAVRATWAAIDAAAATAAGRTQLASTFRLCNPLTDDARDDATAASSGRQRANNSAPPAIEGSGAARLKALLLNVFDTLAMGDYPYPSNYLVFQQTRDPSVVLPAWPMRAACAKFAGASATDPPLTLLRRMAAAAGVLYNASGAARCYELPTSALDGGDGIWDWQFCTQRMPQESYFNLTGTADMFWRFEKSDAAVAAHCAARYPGIVQRPGWIAATSAFDAASAASNIIFSNGELDPWRSGGVLHNLSRTLVAIEVPQGAHHLDLMFSHPEDPPPVRAARDAEVALLREWLAL
jgi:lysosomal Pro-X carboxypeptidase